MKKKIMLLLCIMIILTAGVFSNTSTEETEDREDQELVFNRYPNSLGFGFGSVTGNGILYQRNVGNWAYRGSFLIGYNPDPSGDLFYSSDTKFIYQIGFEADYSLYSVDFFQWFSSRIYLLGLLDQKGEIPYVYMDNTPDNGEDDYQTAGSFIPSVTLGLGFGIEWVIFEHISQYVDVGYQGTWQGRDVPVLQQFLINFFVKSGFAYRY
ncbi:MAG: hypothetical protein ACLFR1_15005 [Spirochaetia bacterium]